MNFKRGCIGWTAVGFFLLAMELGMWVPALGNMFAAHHIEWLLPYVFAIGPLATIITPLIFGSMADRKFSAQNLLGALNVAGSLLLGLAFWALEMDWGVAPFLLFYSLASILGAPSWSLLATVTLANLKNKERNFPLIRVWGTIGWIVAGVLVSMLNWDNSAMAGVGASVVRFLLGLACFMMPNTKPLGKYGENKVSWKTYMGLDALVLFKDQAFRVFLLTSLFFAIPLAAFYMYAPIQLSELGDNYPSARMTLGQVTEIIAMLGLAGLIIKIRLRWVLLTALMMGLLRYGLFASAGLNQSLWLVWLGIALQGPIYAFFYVTGQMLVDRRVPPEMRGQAQALLGVMIGGIGGLVGSLVCGWYYAATVTATLSSLGWLSFWAGLAATILATTIYFWLGYVKKVSD